MSQNNTITYKNIFNTLMSICIDKRLSDLGTSKCFPQKCKNGNSKETHEVQLYSYICFLYYVSKVRNNECNPKLPTCFLVSLCSLFRMVQVSEKLHCVEEKNQNQGARDGSMV